MNRKESQIEFAQWLIENVCIMGIDTFYMPDDIDNNLTMEQVYKIYLTKHS